MIQCPCCGEAVSIGQSRLTDSESEKLPFGNQNTRTPTNIEWRTVKAAAEYYEVTDWIAKVDGSLSAGENVRLMQEHATANVPSGGKSLRRMRTDG